MQVGTGACSGIDTVTDDIDIVDISIYDIDRYRYISGNVLAF